MNHCGCFKNIVNTEEIHEIRKYEIHYRINGDSEIEFIFNDVTNIKNFETKNTELKCKTVYLSKIAHEFKNPLIYKYYYKL